MLNHLVLNSRVYDKEEIGDTDIKQLGPELLLERGRIVSIRRQTQLANMAEAWRIVGIDSEKTDIFDTTFMHLWDSLNMKRWINRDDILWLDENDKDVSETVNQMFATLKTVREKLDKYKDLMKSIMWHLQAEEHKKALAYEKSKKEAARRREKDEERKRKAGAFILDYRS